MRLKDLTAGFLNFLKEFMRSKIGLLGLGMLIFFISTALFAPLIAPSEAYYSWSTMKYWEEYPKGVPPSWYNYFSAKKAADHYVTNKPKIAGKNITFTYDFRCDIPPSDVILRVWADVSDPDRQPGVLFLHVTRPDNRTIKNLWTSKHRGAVVTLKFRVDKTVKDGLTAFARDYETEENLKIVAEQEHLIAPMLILFSKAEPGIILGKAEPLRGEYEFTIQLFLFGRDDTYNGARAVFAGSVFGLLGTDILGRDLFVGIVWGSRLALMIGLLVAVVSVNIGVIYAVISAYFGGTVDEVMQRIMETMASIPLLPILIILSFVMRPTIWNLALLMVLFWWVGPVKTVRSMALQIKEEAYIEAARALGCSGWRIVFKHIVPQILPYTFALMALAVPSAILTEAGISFLMGAVGIAEPTWGRILHDAQRYAATINGMWWWVLTPGLLISLAGLTFVFIGNALDRILNPTLKR